MRRRDVILFGAVAVVVGVAAADTLLDRGDPGPVRTITTMGAAGDPDPTRGERTAGPSLPRAFGGRLFFSDERCEVVELELRGRETTTQVHREKACRLWAPRTGDRLAYGVPPQRRGATWFRVADLPEGQDSRPYLARAGSIVWSPDGRLVAWCSPGQPGGIELEVGARFRALGDCPATYTGSGELVYVRGRSILLPNRLLRTASGEVRALSFGTDGSLAIVSGRVVEVFRPSEAHAPAVRVDLSPFRDQPLFAPDNCGVLLRSAPGGEPAVTLVELGCRGLEGRTMRGLEAGWSPDGAWFAVRAADTIEVYSATETGPAVATIPQRARSLAWTS